MRTLIICLVIFVVASFWIYSFSRSKTEAPRRCDDVPFVGPGEVASCRLVEPGCYECEVRKR